MTPPIILDPPRIERVPERESADVENLDGAGYSWRHDGFSRCQHRRGHGAKRRRLEATTGSTDPRRGEQW
jgi:hypothetical protein